MPAPPARTISTLLSGTSMAPAGLLSCARETCDAPVGQHDRGLAGVGGRRDPGIEARLGALGQRAEAEGGPQPVGSAVADDDHQHEHAEQQQGAQGEGIVAIGARRRPADAQLGQQQRPGAGGARSTARPCGHPRRRASACPRRRTPGGAGCRTRSRRGGWPPPARPAHAGKAMRPRQKRQGQTGPARSCAAAPASRGHRPASDTAMNSPASPSSSQARGQICSNSSAHLLRRTLRSKAPSGTERCILWRADICAPYHARKPRGLRLFGRSTSFEMLSCGPIGRQHGVPWTTTNKQPVVPILFLTARGHIELDGPTGMMYF